MPVFTEEPLQEKPDRRSEGPPGNRQHRRRVSDLYGARILIVDDQGSNLRLLECALHRGGYTAVTSTTDPLEVSDLHRQNRYNLILLDLQMPRMNGFEVMKSLGDLEGDAKVPILVLTADPAQMVPALQAGAAGFLSKPFVLSEVLKRVRLMLERSAARVEEPATNRSEELASSPAHSVIDGR